MASNSFKVKKSLNIEPQSSPTLDQDGDIAIDSGDNKLKVRTNSTTQSMVSEAGTATLTNKTIDADSNTITNIEDADIKSGAAIARNKLATGTANHAVVNDGSGVLSGVAPGTSGNVLTSNGTSWASATPAGAPTSSYEISNLGIAASVAANALTVAIKQFDGSDPASGAGAVKVGFRNATAATGQYSQISITGALSMTVSSGSTLGHVSAQDQYIYVYVLNNAGTAEVALSSRFFDQGSIVSTTAEGGAGAADLAGTIYSTTARSNVAVRCVGRIKIQEATAGTWATAPTEISLWPFGKSQLLDEVFVDTGAGLGSINTKIRRFANIRSNKGNAITYADSSTDGGSFTINIPGWYIAHFSSFYDAGTLQLGISINSPSLTTAIQSVTYANGFRGYVNTSDQVPVRFSMRLYCNIGDVLRGHEGTNVSTSATNAVCFHITREPD